MLSAIFAAFVLCFVLEHLRPGWALPRVRTWPVRVLAINAVQLGVVLLAGFTWERWLSGASLFHLSAHVSPAAGGLIAYFIATFVFYWWHRVRHTNDTLWRLFHQIHHSPQRLEVITSFYKHPGEMVINSLIGSLLVFATLGLSAEAGAVYTLCTALGEFFYHTNVKTPRWVGFFFSGPRCTAFTINTIVTRTTTATSPGGTCSSAPTKIRETGRKPVASTPRRRSGSGTCCATAMLTPCRTSPCGTMPRPVPIE